MGARTYLTIDLTTPTVDISLPGDLEMPELDEASRKALAMSINDALFHGIGLSRFRADDAPAVEHVPYPFFIAMPGS